MRTKREWPVVPRIARGDAITARWLNRLVESANRSLQAPIRPESARSAEPSDITIEATGDPDTQDQLPESTGAQVWTETEKVTETVRIEDPNDSAVFIDVARRVQSTLVSGSDSMTILWNND